MRKGFTLAEVLITLSIIGVVAAITIPSISINNRKVQTETKIRRMYSTIDNIMGRAEIESGERFPSWNLSDDVNNKKEIINKYFKPYLAISKDCTENACSYPLFYQEGKIRHGYNTFSPDICLKDGTCLWLLNASVGGYGDLLFLYDINGEKAPNSVGKDVFWLGVYKNINANTYYLGTVNWNKDTVDINTSKNLCRNEKTSGHGGLYCSQWIYSNGFKIPKDYPWL